ncbi:MAG: hypothetical protein ABIJ56_09790 [Pseudomonadota bacterium]
MKNRKTLTGAAALIPALALLLAVGLDANPIPTPSVQAEQEEGTQNVVLRVRSAGMGCPSGTLYRGTALTGEDYNKMIDPGDQDTAAVATVKCDDFDTSPDSFSEGVTHYDAQLADVCVAPGTYYYQLIKDGEPVTWIDDYSEPITVESRDESCLPSGASDCSISPLSLSGPGLPALLVLFAAALLLGLRPKG